MRVRPERLSQLKMRGPLIWGRSYFLTPHPGGDPADDAASTSAGPFSYAELEEKLKQIPPGSTTAMPSAKMFEVVETVYCTLRYLIFCLAHVFVV